MATSRRSRALDRSARAAGAVLVVVIAGLSVWAHHSLSTGRPVTSTSAGAVPAGAATAAPPRGQLRAWVDDAKPSIDALLIEGDQAVAAASAGDIAGTASACQKTADAVAGAQRHLPSPDPALNTVLQQAFGDYQAGIRHCISGTQKQDAIEIGQGAGFITQGKSDLKKANDVIDADLSSDAVVLTA